MTKFGQQPLLLNLIKSTSYLLTITLLAGPIILAPFSNLKNYTLETAYAAETNTPNMSNLVVFVNFADTALLKGTTNHSHSDTSLGTCFEDADYTFELFDGEDSSGNITNKRAMKQYLNAISYGELRLENIFPQYDSTSHTIIPLTLSENAANYSDDDSKMIGEIISLLNTTYQNKFPNTTFDHVDSGILDNLMIVVACDSDRTNTLFSGHKSTYAGNETISINSNSYLVRNYTLVTEGGAYFGISGSGLLIHEFMHTLGYPDLYHRPASGETTRIPVGAWDIMSQENYAVQYPLAYMRQLISGWVSLPTVTTNQTNYSLTAASATTANNKNTQAVILKTPYSDNEIFVIEYRKQGASYAEDPNTQDYDCKIPGSGLIIYRVNTSLQSNITGAPFLVYVYRPGDTYDTNGYELANADSIYMDTSYLSLESGRISYGSSDSTKTLSDNAITYSDGTNSGIVISNVGSAAGDTITFDITFTENDGQYWNTLTSGHNGESSSQITSYIDVDGSAYYIKHEGTGYSNLGLYQYNTNGWTRLGNAPSSYMAYELQKCNDSLYIAYIDTSGHAHLAKWDSGSWTNLYNSDTYAGEISLTQDNNVLYFTYNSQDGSNLYAYQYSTSGLTSLGTAVGNNLPYAANPTIAATNGNVFVQYREFNNQNNIVVKKYNLSSSSWSNLNSPITTSSYASLYAYNNKLYLLTNGINTAKESYLYSYDLNTNSGWTTLGNSFINENLSEMDLCVYGNTPYVTYLDGSTNKAYVKGLINNVWTQIGTVLSNNIVTGLSISNADNTLYVTYLNSSSNTTYFRTYTVAKEDIVVTPSTPTTPDEPSDSGEIPSDEAYIYDGVDYSAVFNPTYYLKTNEDVKAVFGNDAEQALAHFVNNGMDEGRSANSSFHVHSYRNRYGDLQQAYGDNLKEYYLHYINYGQKEGRDASYSGTTSNSGSSTGSNSNSNTQTTTSYLYKGIDYSSVFDATYYLNNNGDIKAAYGNNTQKALEHFVSYGMSEGRIAKNSFHVLSYRDRYLDLQQAYGGNLKDYYLHYINYGAKEGRDGSKLGTNSNTGSTSSSGSNSNSQTTSYTYNGVDYSVVFDATYYLNNNADIKAAYGNDIQKAFSHFINYGMEEGRIAKASFHVYAYLNRYLDLQYAYGNDIKAYYIHYIQYGIYEGRVGTP